MKAIKKDYFRKYLTKISIYTCFIDILKIPLGIYSANMISNIIVLATRNRIDDVIINSINLLLVLLVSHIILASMDNHLQKLKLTAIHKSKLLMYNKFLNQPLHILSQIRYGDAIERLDNDFNTVASIRLSLYPSLIVNSLTIIVYLGYFIYYGNLIALVLVIIALIQMVPPLIVRKYLEKHYVSNREIEAKVTDCIIEGYNALSTIKLYNIKDWYMDKLKKLSKQERRVAYHNEAALMSENAMDNILECILKYGTYGIMGLFVLNKLIELNTAIAILALSTGFFSASKKMFEVIPNYGIARIAKKRLHEWLQQYEVSNIKGIDWDSQISIENLCLKYEDKVILNGINEVIDLNKVTMIYGDNGMGKSTLLKCLVGILPMSSGKVMIDGQNPTKLSDEYFNQNIYYMPQEDPRFSITAIELYEAHQYSEECKVNAIQFGLTNDDLISKNIKDLSGGERKKVFLALAFASKDKLLVLDEPTNSLDEMSRKVLMDKLVERSKRIIIITHDDQLRHCADDVLVISRGGISRDEQNKVVL